ncbi:MAG: type III-B CRISPR-associated protein Cas10/Cmr2, partial [Bacteroidales bacterium]|nr:type III-B CRISPR-associated protein Cas10/Cmr2 [Bacteroidales bacterium]
TENNYEKGNSLALKDINGNIRFESIMEIASSHFKGVLQKTYKKLVNKHLWNENNGDVDDKETDFISELKNAAGDKFKPHHKYIAIIKADGDKIGSAIKELNGDIVKLQKFSEALFNWAVSCDKAVRNYGAIPIYIGGDDLLMFAPISYGNQNIFDLIDAVDKSFAEAMKDYKGVSLSYGISITYYKFPLFEAITKVDDLLLQAKSLSDNRNAVAIRVLKHSGSELETSFEKGDNPNTFRIIKDVLHAIDENLETKEKSFLNSVGYFLRDNYKTIELIWFNKIRIENFFKNNFEDYVTDEELHLKGGKNLKRATKAEYLYKTKNLIEHIFLVKMPKNTEETEAALTEIYSIIRICRFIKGLEDEK